MEQLDMNLPVKDIFARVILGIDGSALVETEVLACDRIIGKSIIRKNYSAGSAEHEAEAVADLVNSQVAGELLGRNVFAQRELDRILENMICAEQENLLCSEVAFGISLAVAEAAAAGLRQPLYRYLGGACLGGLPVPVIPLYGLGRTEDRKAEKEVWLLPSKGGCLWKQLSICSILACEKPRFLKKKECKYNNLYNNEKMKKDIIKYIKKLENQYYQLGNGTVKVVTEDENPLMSEDTELIIPDEAATLTGLSEQVGHAKEEGHSIAFLLSGSGPENVLEADLAAAFGASWIAAGPVSEAGSIGIYNRLLKIEENMGHQIINGNPEIIK